MAMIIGARWLKAEPVSDQQFRVVLLLIRDDEKTFEQGFNARGATAVQVRDDLTRQLVAMNAVENTKSVLDAFPANFPIPTELDAPVGDPDPEFTAWREALRTFINAKVQLVDTGIVANDDAAVATLKAAVVAGLKAGYADRL